MSAFIYSAVFSSPVHHPSEHRLLRFGVDGDIVLPFGIEQVLIALRHFIRFHQFGVIGDDRQRVVGDVPAAVFVPILFGVIFLFGRFITPVHAGFHKLANVIEVDTDDIRRQFTDSVLEQNPVESLGPLKSGRLDFDERIFLAESIGIFLCRLDAVV
jgi:hypothetical protein